MFHHCYLYIGIGHLTRYDIIAERECVLKTERYYTVPKIYWTQNLPPICFHQEKSAKKVSTQQCDHSHKEAIPSLFATSVSSLGVEVLVSKVAQIR